MAGRRDARVFFSAILKRFQESGGGNQLAENSGVDVGKKLIWLCSLHTGAKAERHNGGAFATPWIPVLRERRASRRERDDGQERG